MGKQFNWLGWLIVIVYTTIFVTLCCLGTCFARVELVFGRNISYSIAALMLIAGSAMLPIWYDWALGKLLPSQKTMATVILKDNSVSRVYDAEGPTRAFIKHFVTFEIPGGNRLVFKVQTYTFNAILVGESGTLTYKMQGKHTYFIAFVAD